MVDDILKLTLLFDFYGELLTAKQKDAFSLYYQNDLSLSEIAAEQGVSRQAVQDQLKRTEKILLDYEDKLGLVEKFLHQKQLVRQIKDIAEQMEETAFSADIKALADRILD